MILLVLVVQVVQLVPLVQMVHMGEADQLGLARPGGHHEADTQTGGQCSRSVAGF